MESIRHSDVADPRQGRRRRGRDPRIAGPRVAVARSATSARVALAAPRIAAPAHGIAAVRFIDFRTIHDPTGNLTPIEACADVPFEIRRVFFLYDVPGGAERGGHAHRTLEEVVIAISGSFDVVTEDGTARARYSLNRAYYGLYLPPMVWMNLENFSSNSVALVLASQPFEERDYYRDRAEFLGTARGEGGRGR